MGDMGEREESLGANETNGDDTPALQRFATRRTVVKATVSVAGGVTAASYVSPALRGLGIPAALALSGTQPPTSQACSIQLSTPTATVTGDASTGGTVSGTFDITNVSSDCGSCNITSVDVYLQYKSSSLGGCGQDLATGLVTHDTGSTGGANPVVANSTMVAAGCNTPQGPYTYSISFPAGVTSTAFRITIEMTVYPTNAQQTGFEFKACTTTS